jgi:chromosome segregation ATPase
LAAVNPDETLERLETELVELHRQMLTRDTAFRAWEDELRVRDEKIAALEAEIARLEPFEPRVEELVNTIREMQDTRVWRIGSSFWSWRDRLRGAGRR